MNRVRTADLIGKQLDWAVAQAEAIVNPADAPQIEAMFQQGRYTPSTNWSQGGPFMEREQMQVRLYIGHEYPWFVETRPYGRNHRAGRNYGQGVTLLEAVTRCFVAATLGPEITLPEQDYA